MSDELIEVMAKYLEVDPNDLSVSKWEHHDLTVFRHGSRGYAIGNSDSVDRAAADCIKESLWAFNAKFIIEHTNLPYEAIDMIKRLQEERYEGANATIKALITDIDDFIEAAISADGRGHFLATYDSEEHEQNGFFIYRVD